MREDLFLSGSAGAHQTKLYLCPNVPADTVFATQTRQEISQIAWFKLTDLPSKPNSANASQFFLVAPFVKPLRTWVQRQLALQAQAPAAKTRSVKTTQQQKSSSASGMAKSESAVNAATFGSGQKGWGVQEMFQTNEKLFGVVSNYSYDLYTTKLPSNSDLQTPARSGLSLFFLPQVLIHLTQRMDLPVPAVTTVPVKPRRTNQTPVDLVAKVVFLAAFDSFVVTVSSRIEKIPVRALLVPVRVCHRNLWVEWQMGRAGDV